MDCEYINSNKPILIYFKTRGNAQVIRCVLLEAGIDFDEVYVGWNGYLDPQIIEKYKLDLKSLPYLIHNGLPISGVFPIIKYCCAKFQRTDLLGKTLEDSIHIAQIMVKYTRQKGMLLHMLFKGLKQIHQKKLGQEGMKVLSKNLLALSQQKKHLDPIRRMFKKTGQFLCGYLTILDFVFYDKCFYGCNFHLNCDVVTDYPDYQIAFQYKQFFQSTQFFIKHNEKLSQYKVFFPEVDTNVNQLIKGMWKGDLKYVTCD